MEPLSNLLYLLEPASLALIGTAVLVVLASAHRALVHEKESERHKDLLDSSITLSGRQALMIPVASSVSLLLMFYLFASVSQLITAFTALAAASSVIFALSPAATHLAALLGGGGFDPIVSRGCCGTLTRSQLLLATASTVLVLAWLVSGHWVLNNLLGIAICAAFVSHVRLPNMKVCALLLGCLFVYDVFWVFFSEQFFGANVMVTVATQQAHNPVHTVASSLHFPASQTIAKKLDLPVKLLFPRNLLHFSPDPITNSSSDGDGVERSPSLDYMMLGLGDMAIPGMLLALVLCFEHRRAKEIQEDLSSPSPLGSHSQIRGSKYVWYATVGYAVGLIAALAAGVLTRAPQPALLYLVPSTLGPVAGLAWSRRELGELWNGSTRMHPLFEKDKAHTEVSASRLVALRADLLAVH